VAVQVLHPTLQAVQILVAASYDPSGQAHKAPVLAKVLFPLLQV